MLKSIANASVGDIATWIWNAFYTVGEFSLVLLGMYFLWSIIQGIIQGYRNAKIANKTVEDGLNKHKETNDGRTNTD